MDTVSLVPHLLSFERLQVAFCLSVCIALAGCGERHEGTSPTQSVPADDQEIYYNFTENCASSQVVNFDCSCVNQYVASTTIDQTKALLANTSEIPASTQPQALIDDLVDLAIDVHEFCAGVLRR